jgi:hypothetical protein
VRSEAIRIETKLNKAKNNNNGGNNNNNNNNNNNSKQNSVPNERTSALDEDQVLRAYMGSSVDEGSVNCTEPPTATSGANGCTASSSVSGTSRDASTPPDIGIA